MPLFVITAQDKPAGLDMRMAHRAEHLAYISAQSGVVKVAGPFLDAKGDMEGSLLIVETADLAAAQAFAAADPFAKAGLFVSCTVRPWRTTVGGFA